MAFGDGFAQKFAGTHGVKQSFAGERIHESAASPTSAQFLPDHGSL